MKYIVKTMLYRLAGQIVSGLGYKYANDRFRTSLYSQIEVSEQSVKLG